MAGVAFGIDGLALKWIRTFLVERTQQALYMGQLSSTGHLNFGVPQRSVLGPLLFLLYTAELSEIYRRKGLVAHSFADDLQVYLSLPAAEAVAAVQQFTESVKLTDRWMQCNRLKLNTDNTQLDGNAPTNVEGQYRQDQPTRQHSSFLFECVGPGCAHGWSDQDVGSRRRTMSNMFFP